MAKRLLILENGMIFEGEAFGADLFVTGEIVFNTGMTGYQESITDQSYNGQILTFTYVREWWSMSMHVVPAIGASNCLWMSSSKSKRYQAFRELIQGH